MSNPNPFHSDLMSNMFKEVSQKIKKLLRELNGIY